VAERGEAEQVKDALREWLETIRGVTCYRDRLRVYAPTCYGACVGAVERLTKRISEALGGATVYDAEGCWVNERGELECEPVKVIESAHHCLSPSKAREVAEAIGDYAREADQRYLAVEEGTFFITSSEEFMESLKKFRM